MRVGRTVLHVLEYIFVMRERVGAGQSKETGVVVQNCDVGASDKPTRLRQIDRQHIARGKVGVRGGRASEGLIVRIPYRGRGIQSRGGPADEVEGSCAAPAESRGVFHRRDVDRRL